MNYHTGVGKMGEPFYFASPEERYVKAWIEYACMHQGLPCHDLHIVTLRDTVVWKSTGEVVTWEGNDGTRP